jgi:small subunit ribosomal protein S6
MKYYELTYIFSPTLTEEQATSFHEKVGETIKEQGGTPIEMKPIVKRALAYEIEKCLNAYLGVILFKIDDLSSLEKILKEENNILRYLLIRKEEKQKVAKPARRPSMPKAEKSNLEDLDKKIEEILN